MDLKQIEDLIELMRRSGVTQLSLELPDYKVSIKRGAAEPDEEIASTLQAGPAQAEFPSEAETAAPPARDTVSVASPVVGVFHNGGMIGPREMIKEGDRVHGGQLLAAIEAMKVPNELRAPVSGIIASMLVEDGAAVEYGQTLFLIEPEPGHEASYGETVVGLA